jgi:hypothetical protein
MENFSGILTEQAGVILRCNLNKPGEFGIEASLSAILADHWWTPAVST